ncbi:hypothetical protein ABZ863_00565 [Saccharomonospora sp. NPDC046836]|uniref:hypothetical protein n=1 Tax=Saccharomonospora sp. NPDC046836 TaxID=3156921 RepID=UPI0033DCB759
MAGLRRPDAPGERPPRPRPEPPAEDAEGTLVVLNGTEVALGDVPPEPEAAGPEAETPRRSSYSLVAALLVTGVLFAALAVVLQLQHSEVSARTQNTALLDVAGTAQVKQEMSTAAESLFSIDYNDIGKTERAANDLLVNDEVRQKYNVLMGEVKRLAPEQRIVVTVKATRSAVVLLNGDRAKVMVYIDQTATRAADNQTSAGGAALWFVTEKRDGRWKVTDMDTYSPGQAPGRNGN